MMGKTDSGRPVGTGRHGSKLVATEYMFSSLINGLGR